MSSHVENLTTLTDRFGLVMNYANKDPKLSYVCIDRSVFINRSDIGAIIGEAPRLCHSIGCRLTVLTQYYTSAKRSMATQIQLPLAHCCIYQSEQ